VVALGWLVLGLVFLDELLAMVGLGVYGWSTSARWLLVWLLPLLAVLAWFLFASPKARFGSAVVRPVVKVVVFGLASWGLWAAGHHSWAVALLVFSVVVNGLAQLRSIRDLAEVSETGPPASR
jgi:Protein of unknown function (DUF2568)